MVYQGEINAVYLNGSAVSNQDLKPVSCNHIQYVPEYFSLYDKGVVGYHIDIIKEKFLPSYLRLIEDEMTKIKKVLQRQKKVVVGSIDKIVAECQALETKPETYRKCLEYKF